jgi:hypothetical protein
LFSDSIYTQEDTTIGTFPQFSLEAISVADIIIIDPDEAISAEFESLATY